MKKKISFITQGQGADIGEYIINRILVNRYSEIIGPFVFLNHLLPLKHSPRETLETIKRDAAHSHRGIATFTYILNDQAENLGSKGNHAIVRFGEEKWMNAGEGIIRVEVVNIDSQTNDPLSKQMLSHNRGWLKLIAGEYEDMGFQNPGLLKAVFISYSFGTGKGNVPR